MALRPVVFNTNSRVEINQASTSGLVYLNGEVFVPTVTTTTASSITSSTASSGGNVTDQGSTSVTIRGVQWSLYSNFSSIAGSTNDGTGAGTFSSSLTSLSYATTYYYRAYAKNSVGYGYGSTLSFTTSCITPSVTTTTASSITSSSASSGGNVTSDGGCMVTARGVQWSLVSNFSSIAGSTTDGSGTGSYTSSMTSLNYATTYYYRAYATNSAGTSYGTAYSFTTSCIASSVTTTTASSITSSTASAGGNVTSDGGCSVTARGVCYGTSPNPTISGTKTSDGTGTGVFASSLTSLNYATTYYYRAYSTTSAGTSYGTEYSFTTLCVEPTVTTTTATSINTTTASSGGNVTSSGGCTVTARGVCYGTSPNPTISGTKTSDGTGTGVFTSSLTSLSVGTKYYYRAYATNDQNLTGYGTEYSFTTMIETLSSSNILQYQVTVGGNVGNLSNTERGIVYSSTNNTPTTGDTKQSSGSGTGSYSVTLTNLTANTTYYYRAYAISGGVPTYGAVYTVRTLTDSINCSTGTVGSGGAGITEFELPIPSNLSNGGVIILEFDPQSVPDKLEILHGSSRALYPNSGWDSATRKATSNMTDSYASMFDYDTEVNPANITYQYTLDHAQYIGAAKGAMPTKTNYLLSDTDISVTLSGGYDQVIWWKFSASDYATNSYAKIRLSGPSGTAWSVYRVCTDDTIPTVTTTSASSVTSSSASTGGNVTSLGSGTQAVSARGVCYSTSPNPTLANSYTVDGTGSGIFTSSLTSLSPNTTYYVRAYATNKIGTAYGSQISFTTLCLLPTVTTTTASSITSSSASSGGNVTSDGGCAVTSKGVCWSTSQNPTLANSYTIDGSGIGVFSSSITALAPNTTYYVRAYATNSQGTSYGSQISFTTLNAVPSVYTNSITDITQTTATGGGDVYDDGGSSISTRGICWSISPNPMYPADSYTTDGSGLGAFTSYLGGLNGNTTYFVRAYAVNGFGTGYGNEVDFTTSPVLPSVITTSVSNITSTTADGGGNVYDNGGATVTARGVCYSTTSNPTISGTHTTDGSGVGSFTSSLTGLAIATLYYYRAYATNSVGTAYGTQYTFTTNCVVPTVTTSSIINIASTTADGGGNVTNAGGCSVTARGICWNTTGSPTISDSKTTNGTGTGSFTSYMTGLVASTTYYVRAYATNSGGAGTGTGYGSQVSFTTASAGAGYYDCGYGCQYYSYNPGCPSCSPGAININMENWDGSAQNFWVISDVQVNGTSIINKNGFPVSAGSYGYGECSSCDVSNNTVTVIFSSISSTLSSISFVDSNNVNFCNEIQSQYSTTFTDVTITDDIALSLAFNGSCV